LAIAARTASGSAHEISAFVGIGEDLGAKGLVLEFPPDREVIGFAPVERRNWYAAQVTTPAALTREKGVARKTAKNAMHEASPISPSAAPTP